MPSRCLIDFPRDQQPRLRGCFEAPREVLQARHIDDVIPLLRKVEQYAKAGRWAVGMVAYEAASAFDPALVTQTPHENFPLAAFAIFDEVKPLPPSNTESFSCTPWKNDWTKKNYMGAIERIRNDIAKGDYYQTNFTSRLLADFKGDAEAFFHALTEAQPDGYSLFLDFGDWQVASVSPELFFAWHPDNQELITRPMKGTSSLTHSASELKTSAKDQAENLMIVDLLRNDLSRICTDVKVPHLFNVETLPTVRQMTSTVTGTTRPDVELADIFKALFPCGSVTGAPKIAAMQAIKTLETSPRGAYCGALGVVQPGGAAIFNVGIRSVTMTNDKAVCGIGSGITWDSKPAEEYAENQIKQRFLWRASASFDLLETLRLEDGKLWLFEQHMNRLRQSAEYFGFALNMATVTNALNSLAKTNSTGLHRLRILVDRKGQIKTELHTLEPNPEFVDVALATKSIDSDDEFVRHKTTNRAVYEAFKPTQPDIFDTLLFNRRGDITEFTRGNVAVELNGQLCTPPLSCGLLAGTLREEMLANGKMSERTITLDDLQDASGLWFFNGLRGMIKARLIK